jgi:hypothetical protein
MNPSLAALAIVALTAINAAGGENPVFRELVEKGITMSNGAAFKLPPPFLADRLDADGQRAAIAKTPLVRTTVKEFLAKSSYAPVEIKVTTLKASKGEGPAVRAIDVWFVAHGDWKTLTEKDFLKSVAGKEEGKSHVVSKSGVLNAAELAKRKLTATTTDDRQQQFLYTTFSLFDRVQVSATRFSTVIKGKDSILAAGRIDPRFDKDPDYPNQWRPLERDARAEIKVGLAHPFAHAGGYAKITRLAEPAGAVFIECHIIYEEDYAWFDGANLVKQKVPAMVQELVRTFRRKLAIAGEAKAEKKGPKP